MKKSEVINVLAPGSMQMKHGQRPVRLSSSPLKSLKLCLLAQVKALMDPSLNSLNRPTSSAPESSLCLEDPTRNMLGFSFSSALTPGPSCFTNSSAPGRKSYTACDVVPIQWKGKDRAYKNSPPFCWESSIRFSSHCMASSLVSEASSSTTRGVKPGLLLSPEPSILWASSGIFETKTWELKADYWPSLWTSWFLQMSLLDIYGEKHNKRALFDQKPRVNKERSKCKQAQIMTS